MRTIKYVAGNPGSGKTTFINRYRDELGKEAFVLDYNNYKDYSLLDQGYTQDQIHQLSVEAGRKEFLKHLCAEDDIIFECTLANLYSEELFRNLAKIKNRGYWAELYSVSIEMDIAKERNAKRIFPTPEDKFCRPKGRHKVYTLFDFHHVHYQDTSNNTKMIKDKKDSLYDGCLFYKGFKEPQRIGEIISVDGPVERDKNAIYFAQDWNIPLLYGAYVYEVKPIGSVYKFFNSFYSRAVKIIQKWPPSFDN